MDESNKEQLKHSSLKGTIVKIMQKYAKSNGQNMKPIISFDQKRQAGSDNTHNYAGELL